MADPKGKQARRVRRNWLARVIGDRMARLTRPSLVYELSVAGRRSGRIQRTPVVVLDHAGGRYLVSAFGHSDWTKNLRSSQTGRLRARGAPEEFAADLVPTEARPPIIDAYLRRFGKMPGVAAAFRQLPEPADHPTFRVLAAPQDAERR
jgi:deazaflavin-dependent oxidoreductase (nitroreductase family)